MLSLKPLKLTLFFRGQVNCWSVCSVQQSCLPEGLEKEFAFISPYIMTRKVRQLRIIENRAELLMKTTT